MSSFCDICKKWKTCKKICAKLEKILPKNQTGRLKGEFYLSSDLIDRVFYFDESGKVINREKDGKKHPNRHRYNENYELES
jgi:hypothetical protein